MGQSPILYNKKNKKNRPTHQKNFSCVGTAYYVAPEVLKKTGYSEDIDWWSVGVIFFEMLVGYAPFCSEETKDVCYKVINWKKFLKIPDDIVLSREAEDLIAKMINNSNERLGKNGVEEIKAHPFFKNVNWNNIRNTKAPFIPELKNDYDTKYFESFEYEEEFYPPVKKFKRRKDIEFLGYTYKEGDELYKDVYDDEDEIDKCYRDILEKYQIGIDNNYDKQKKANGRENINNNNNSMQIYHPSSNLNKEKMKKINNKSNGLSNGGDVNEIWPKNKTIVYVKNQNKIKYSPKNIKKGLSPILYNKINVNKSNIQSTNQKKPLKTIKIVDKKNNEGINLYLAKSANNIKKKYTKVKIGLNNNLSNKSNKIRLSPVINNKKLDLSLNNSDKKIIGNKINSKIKLQSNKKDINIKNLKFDNFTPNKAFKA